jgi:hypothetical protein
MGPYAGVEYNLTLCRHSRHQHIYHGQPYARVDFIPQSGTKNLASLKYFYHGSKENSKKISTLVYSRYLLLYVILCQTMLLGGVNGGRRLEK